MSTSAILPFKTFLKEDPSLQYPRLTTKEAAVELRLALKKIFPSTQFSVKMDRGSSIYVRWVDGPTDWQVDRVADQFEGRGFDGSNDSNYVKNKVIKRADGTMARAPFDFVFTSRTITDVVRRKVLASLEAKGYAWAKDITIEGTGANAHFKIPSEFWKRREDGFDYNSIEATLRDTMINMTGSGLIMRQKY